jgi:hypothetical protein
MARGRGRARGATGTAQRHIAGRSRLDWPGLVKKYVWHDEKTPYFVAVARLTRAQARSELFTYAFLLVSFASGVMLVASFGLGSPRVGMLGSPGAALYALTLAVAAGTLSLRAHPAAALYCASAPLALLLGTVLDVIRPGMTAGEQRLLGLVSALWLLYALRVVRITRSGRAR